MEGSTLKRLFGPVLLCGMLLLAACGGAGSTDSGGTSDSYTDISVAQLQQMLVKKDFVLVNTHIPFEGDMPKTDLSVPYDKTAERLDRFPADKDAKIVLYCRTGRMSTDAAETLVDKGYTNVFELDGGMVAWEEAGLPLEGR